MSLGYYLKCAVIGVVTGLLNGLFGSGGGTIVVPAMTLYLNINERSSHATALLIILPLTIISSMFYISNNYVDWVLLYKTAIGGIAGGIVGALLLKKIPEDYLRIIFGSFIIFVSIRMVFFK